MLAEKRIVLGITGGIAAYKSCYIVRNLVKKQATVDVMMTEAAQEFVTPLTLETLSGRPVTLSMFGEGRAFGTHHIDIIQAADIVLIAPATYNLIGKVVNGIADDFLSTAISAATSPVFFAPAMNSFMFANPIFQENLTRLKKYYSVIMPGAGELACGYTGEGRMAEPDAIVAVLEKHLADTARFHGKNIVITAGPTREKIDPVRFISNFSSGKMGFALAESAAAAGAKVTLITGPVDLATPTAVTRVDVETAEEMLAAVLQTLPQTDVLIKAAAVADYRPKEYHDQKIKKTQAKLTIELEKTPDILAAVKTAKLAHTCVIGFALETNHEVDHARQKLQNKDLDMIVINNPKVEGAGFRVDTNVVSFLYRDNTLEALPLMSKKDVAHEILIRVEELLKKHQI